MSARNLIAVARGETPAEVVVRGGRVVNVHTAECLVADIAIADGMIAFVGDAAHTIGPSTEVIDAAGLYLTPGLIETHQHVGGTHLSMTEFAKVIIPHGTTAIVTDFYEMGSVGGVDGIRFCLDELKATGIKVLFCIPMPSFYQNRPFTHLGTVSLDDMTTMLRWPDCYGVNEAMTTGLAGSDEALLGIVDEARALGKVVVAHGAETPHRDLQAAVAYVGRTSDHEATTAEEAIAEARLGLHVLIREGSAATDLVAVVKAITEHGLDPRMFAFSTDEDDARRMVRLGHLDEKIRMAVNEGVPPITAVQMATLNAAEASGVAAWLGSLVPGKAADIVFARALAPFDVARVMINGRIVAADGHMTAELARPAYPARFRETVRLGFSPDRTTFSVPVDDGAAARVRVIVASEGALASEEQYVLLPVVDGQVPPAPEDDILKIAVLDRHTATGKVGIGFIRGFGLREGALGSCYNPCIEDMVILGANEDDMAAAARALTEMQGGFVAVRGGEVIASVAMPLFGMLATESLETVLPKMEHLDATVRAMGCPLQAPFHTLAFMAWPGHFGALKMSREGIANVWEGVIVPPVEAAP